MSLPESRNWRAGKIVLPSLTHDLDIDVSNGLLNW